MAQRKKKKVPSNRLNIKAKIYVLLIAAVAKEIQKLIDGSRRCGEDENSKENMYALHDIYRLSLFL